LRAALEDDPEKPTFIETIPRRGYRFIAPVYHGSGPDLALSDSTFVTSRRFRRYRRIWFASGVAALLAIVLAAWRITSARPALTGTDVILLATFVNRTGDPIFDNSLDKALEVKLTESPFLSLLSEADTRATLRTMRHDPGEPVTRDLGIEICKRQGLKAVVVPEIVAIGTTYLITLEAIDSQNQRVIAREQGEAASKNKVVVALGKAASQLRRQLGESPSSLGTYNAPLDLATTGSLEALQAYRNGQILYRSGKQRESISFFERAIELDPQFCSAYNMLGSAYHSSGDEQASRLNFAKAFQLKDARLTQEENFQTNALYNLSTTGNLEKATAVLVLYKQIYPRSIVAHNELGIAYAQIGRLEEALQEFSWGIEHSPVLSASFYSNASQAFLMLGRPEDAKRLLDQWRQKGSLNPFLKTLRYQVAFLERDLPMLEQLSREAPADDILWMEIQTKLAFFRGESSKLRSLSESMVKQQSRANQKVNAAEELARHAVLESYLGNHDLARELCRQAEETGNDSASGLVDCAKALGNSGELAQAQVVAAKLDRLFPEDTCRQRVHLPLIRSIIERKRGHAVEAAELLVPVAQYEQTTKQVPYERAEAYLAAGNGANAAVEFKRILDHPGWPESWVIAPLAQLGLARAYAMQGEREKSQKAYDVFFATWKDADANIPILRQAKMEYKKLIAKGQTDISDSDK